MVSGGGRTGNWMVWVPVGLIGVTPDMAVAELVVNVVKFVRSTMANMRWRICLPSLAPSSGPNCGGVELGLVTWKKPTVKNTAKTLLRVVTLLNSFVNNCVCK